MSDSKQLRRLPWDRLDGQPAYLSAGSENGIWARLADNIEASQVQSAEEVAEYARLLLTTPRTSRQELAWALARSLEALNDVLRIAESRDERIDPATEVDEPPVRSL